MVVTCLELPVLATDWIARLVVRKKAAVLHSRAPGSLPVWVCNPE